MSNGSSRHRIQFLPLRRCAPFAAAAFLALSAGPIHAATTLEVFIRPNTGDEPIYQAIKAGFEQTHPDIKIQYLRASFGEYWQKIPVLYAGGDAPDVIFPSTSKAAEYALKNMLLPLDNVASQDHFDLSQYFSPILAAYRVNGTLYALPNDFAALAYVYNADLFSQNGIATPSLNWNWDQYLTITRKLTKADASGKVTTFGATSAPNTQFIWSATGTNFFDNDLWPSKFLLDTPNAYEGLQFIQDLAWKYNVVPHRGQSANFLGGTAAMQPIGHWTLPQIMSGAKFKWGLLSLPQDKFAVQRGDGSGWAIMRTTKHPKEAWEFLKYIAGSPGELLQAKLQFITPANKQAAFSSAWRDIPSHPDVSPDAFVQGLDHAFNNYILTNPRVSDFTALINPALSKIYNNQATPKNAISAIVPAIDKLLAEVGQAKSASAQK